MLQDRLGLGIADAVGQSRQRLEAVDGDSMTGRDLRSQAGLPEPVERAMPEGDDIGPHASPYGAKPVRVKKYLKQTTRKRSGPGARGLRLFLIGVDRGLLLHGEADVVEAVHQAVLAERINFEFYRAAVGAADFLGGEI